MRKVLLFCCVLLSAILVGRCRKDERIQIGILQYSEHVALSEARQGFIDGLRVHNYIDGENIKITVLNPEGDANALAIQANKLVRQSDLILAIATPAASAVVNEAKLLNKEIPILFTAVTDPVDAKLIASNEKPGGFVTGTNDLNPIELQLSLIDDLIPEAKSLGIIYNGSETNSEIQADLAREIASQKGLSVTTKTIESVNDLEQIARQLAKNVDCFYLPTDNLIAGSMGIINEVVLQNKIIAITGDVNMVPEGGSITYGLNYYNLGFQTAEMASEILSGNKSPSEIPSVGLKEYSLVINKKQLDDIGIIIPEDLLAKADKVIH